MKTSIAVITETYPAPTEQFIYRGIRELSRKGIDIRVFYLRRGEGEDILGPGGSEKIPRFYSVFHMWRMLVFIAVSWKAFFRNLWDTVFHTHRMFRDVYHFMTAAGYACRASALNNDLHFHAEFAGLPALYARIAASITGKRYSVSAHARDVLVPDEWMEENLEQSLFTLFCTKAVEEYAVKKIDGISRKTDVVYHGLPLESSSVPDRAFSDETLRITALGRFVEKKGFSYLIQACGILKKRGVDVRCIIAGEGKQKKEYDTFVNVQQLEEEIVFPGFLSPDQVAGMFTETDVLCVPSVRGRDGDMDGIPNVILEAALAGIPAVASAVSGIPEAVTDGFNGYLVRPGAPEELADALARFHRLSAEEKKDMSKNAYLILSEKFDISRNMDQWIETFRKHGVQI